MMERIPKNYLIDSTIKKLGDSCRKLYEEKIGKDFRAFLLTVFYEELIDSETGRAKKAKEIRGIFNRDKFKRTKKNWLKSLQQSLKKPPKTRKELLGEIDYIQEGIDRYGIEKFRQTYHVNDIDEFIKKRLQEIEDWVKNDNENLTDYFYINEKTPLQIETALKVDAIMCITNIVINEYGGDYNSIVREMSDLVNDYALPGKHGITKFKKSSISQDVVDEYRTTEDVIIKTLILNDENSQNAIAIKSLTKVDWKIFHYILSQRDIEFVERQKIFVDIGDIVKNVYSSRNKQSYKAVENSLSKMQQILFQIYDSKGNKFSFQMLGNIKYQDYTNGGTRAEINIPDSIHQAYLENHVTRVYSDNIKDFIQEHSEELYFILQKERFYKKDTEETAFPYPYTFFTRRIRFTSRNKETIIKTIYACLNEIEQTQSTVKHFSKKNDTFYITFIPVSNHELEDLIDNRTVSIPNTDKVQISG